MAAQVAKAFHRSTLLVKAMEHAPRQRYAHLAQDALGIHVRYTLRVGNLVAQMKHHRHAMRTGELQLARHAKHLHVVITRRHIVFGIEVIAKANLADARTERIGKRRLDVHMDIVRIIERTIGGCTPARYLRAGIFPVGATSIIDVRNHAEKAVGSILSPTGPISVMRASASAQCARFKHSSGPFS